MPSSFFPTWFSDVIRRGRRTDKQKCHDHDGQKEETNTHCGLPEPPNVTSTVPSDWKYISEGGATAVFSYIGPHHNMFNGTVLRLRKSGSVSNSEKDDPSIAFQNQCISRLIPSIHLANLRPVHVTTIWLVEFARFHEKHRPAQRRSLAGIDTARTHAVVANDLVGSSPLVVEIKPKWSFMPNPRYLSDKSRLAKQNSCRFCMHARTKHNAGKTVALHYCPLDLFSSDRDRLRKALHSLFDDWLETDGHINNLKLFVHGQKIGPKHRFSMTEGPDTSTDNLRIAFSEALIPSLIDSPVLGLLKRHQRTLDSMDIEGLCQLWKQISPNTDFASDLYACEPTQREWSTFFDAYEAQDYPTTRSDLRHHILAYLLSATLKDCSVMIRLNLLDVDSPGQSVNHANITIIDLDPKNMAKFSKWRELDEIIVQTYIDTPLSERKSCVDSDIWE